MTYDFPVAAINPSNAGRLIILKADTTREGTALSFLTNGVEKLVLFICWNGDCGDNAPNFGCAISSSRPITGLVWPFWVSMYSVSSNLTRATGLLLMMSGRGRGKVLFTSTWGWDDVRNWTLQEGRVEVLWWTRAWYYSSSDLAKWKRLSKVRCRRWTISR